MIVRLAERDAGPLRRVRNRNTALGTILRAPRKPSGNAMMVASNVPVIGVEPERNELERIFLEVTKGEVQ